MPSIYTGMEAFDWWEAPTSGRVEWKYTSLEHGALLLTLPGIERMHKLSVEIWATLNQVIKIIIAIR